MEIQSAPKTTETKKASDKKPFHYAVGQADLETESDQKDILRLWTNSFPELNGSFKLNWYYIDNPDPNSRIYLLRDLKSNSNIGLQGLGARTWWIDNREVSVYSMTDFAVDQEHRSIGPAIALAKQGFLLGSETGRIVYGAPNPKAAPVIKRAGFKKLGQITRFAKVIQSREKLQERLPELLAKLTAPILDKALQFIDFIKCPGLSLSYQTGQTLASSEIWERLDKKRLMLGKRDKQYLEWQLRCPNKQLFTVNDRSGNIGYVVYTSNQTHIAIHDFLAIDFNKSMQRTLKAFTSYARSLNATNIALEFFGHPDVIKSLKFQLFYPRDSRPLFISLPKDEHHSDLSDFEYYYTSSD